MPSTKLSHVSHPATAKYLLWKDTKNNAISRKLSHVSHPFAAKYLLRKDAKNDAKSRKFSHGSYPTALLSICYEKIQKMMTSKKFSHGPILPLLSICYEKIWKIMPSRKLSHVSYPTAAKYLLRKDTNNDAIKKVFSWLSSYRCYISVATGYERIWAFIAKGKI